MEVRSTIGQSTGNIETLTISFKALEEFIRSYLRILFNDILRIFISFPSKRHTTIFLARNLIAICIRVQ